VENLEITMSRIGKLPIKIPSGVTVEKKDGRINVQGPKGSLARPLMDGIDVSIESDTVLVTPLHGRSKSSEAHGLFRSLISNMVEGVSEGFEKTLEINGVGYRVAANGSKLSFSLGYSHPVEFDLPEGMTASIEKQTVLTLKTVSKEELGSVAAKIRGLRPPEPYKGKGIKYSNEKILRKAGKTGK